MPGFFVLLPPNGGNNADQPLGTLYRSIPLISDFLNLTKCMEYDDSIVRQMVECIKVYPGGKLEIIFGGGYLVEESV